MPRARAKFRQRAKPSFFRHLLIGLGLGAAALVCFVLVAEVSLRVAGFGAPRGFFIREQNEDGAWLRENPQVARPYFPSAEVPRPFPFRIPAEKGPETVRIVVLGSSAAKGDPEPAFSVGRMLAVMLEDAYPERVFEVVNAGIPQVNSHVVRRIAADAAGMEPDFFVVYTGNNEVVGPFGPGSAHGDFLRSRFMVDLTAWMRGLRLSQAFAAIADRYGRDHESEDMRDYLGRVMRPTDRRLGTVYRHFDRNLGSIVESARRNGADVLLATVPTNVKDLPPFQPLLGAAMTDTERREWERNVFEADELNRAGQTKEALASLQRAMEMDRFHAGLRYAAGGLYLDLGDAEAAREEFVMARDYDGLRLRADSAINDIIRETADRTVAEFVDLKAALKNESPDRILGNETIHEHVLLNFRGAYVVAKALFQSVAARMEEGVEESAGIPEPLDYDRMRFRLGFTLWEQYLIHETLLDRVSRPPFKQLPDVRARTARLEQLQSEMEAGFSREGTFVALEGLYREILEESPDDWVLQRNFGRMLMNWRQEGRALPHLEDAYAQVRTDRELLHALGSAYAAMEFHEEAHAVFLQLKETDPRYPGVDFNLGLMRFRMEDYRRAAGSFDRVLRTEPEHLRARVLLHLSQERIGREDRAEHLFERLIARYKGNADRLDEAARYYEANGEPGYAERLRELR